MTTKNPGPTYPNLRPWDLEPHYSMHVSKMTEEGLHSKAAIAEQLAWRDQTIEKLREQIALFQSILNALDAWVDSPTDHQPSEGALIDAHQAYWTAVRAQKATMP